MTVQATAELSEQGEASSMNKCAGNGAGFARSKE